MASWVFKKELKSNKELRKDGIGALEIPRYKVVDLEEHLSKDQQKVLISSRCVGDGITIQAQCYNQEGKAGEIFPINLRYSRKELSMSYLGEGKWGSMIVSENKLEHGSKVEVSYFATMAILMIKIL
ncbi:hypothetical protein Dimus_018990 [Dionaea muscipula]